MEEYINITLDKIDQEHICCAISDKKHFEGVFNKKEWLKKRITEGHVFRKLNVQGKVFVEYAPLEKAWVPIEGSGFLYIYCLWVSGKFKGHGYGKQLLEYVINDAKKKGKQGVCVISSKKKKSYLADKKFFLKYGFEVVDQIEDYELLSLSFNHQKPFLFNKICETYFPFLKTDQLLKIHGMFFAFSKVSTLIKSTCILQSFMYSLISYIQFNVKGHCGE